MSGIGLFGLIGGIFLNNAGSEAILGEAFAVDGLSIALIFGSSVWQMLDSGVRCRGTRDGWFYLKGISPASLAQFAARSEEAPVPRLRKVYRFYEHRLPLTVLLRNYWYNPWAVIFLAVLKARRSSALESLLLHHGEATGKPWSQGDPQLMEQWESETRGTEMRAKIYGECFLPACPFVRRRSTGGRGRGTCPVCWPGIARTRVSGL